MKTKSLLHRILVAIALMAFSLDNSLCQNHPNVLLIIADDMGIDITPGFQENERMPHTPNLDMLRTLGISYQNTWSAPTCTPTRAAILSGKYGIKTDIMRAPGNLELLDTSLFQMIDVHSSDLYAQAFIGKWHLSNPVDFQHPNLHGIDHFEGTMRASVDDYYSWTKVTNGVESIETDYVTSHLTNAAIDWVAQQDQPWFLCLAHPAPHGPFHVPPNELYTT
ncbi:MAG: sulfatase-like hydrolase/transferase, partial [Saprospiraceae bacterium]|nr:sulfatase-like hydrolase/transferase [Saprospiraceae bacterium]